MLLEIGKAVSLLLSILSVDALLGSAFLVPGTRWDERLFHSLTHVLLSGCVCLASGLLFSWPSTSAAEISGAQAEPSSEGPDLFHTLPVRLYFWALAAMAVLFTVSWYLEQYYVPMLWRNQPH